MEIKVDKVDKFVSLKDINYGGCFASGDNYYIKTQQQPDKAFYECVNMRTAAVAAFEVDRRVMPIKAVVTITNFWE